MSPSFRNTRLQFSLLLFRMVCQVGHLLRSKSEEQGLEFHQVLRWLVADSGTARSLHLASQSRAPELTTSRAATHPPPPTTQKKPTLNTWATAARWCLHKRSVFMKLRSATLYWPLEPLCGLFLITIFPVSRFLLTLSPSLLLHFSLYLNFLPFSRFA
jgi:hypothetical protein